MANNPTPVPPPKPAPEIGESEINHNGPTRQG